MNNTLPIIDIHTHLAYLDVFPKAYIGEMISNGNKSESEVMEAIVRMFMNDKNGENHLHQIDQNEINKSVLLIIDGGIGMGEATLSIEAIYELHAEVLKKNKEKLIVFGGMDPRRGEAGYNLFKKGITEFGFQGLKLYPPMGFAMDDERLMPFYKLCESHGFPVLIHSGPSLSSLQNHFAHPIHLLPVAEKFPAVNFILAHAALNLTDPDVQKCLKVNNIFADISGYQKHIQTYRTHKDNDLTLIFDERFNSKILFGTDWPLFNLMNPIKQNIADLLEIWNNSIHQDECLMRNILYNNAKQLLN